MTRLEFLDLLNMHNIDLNMVSFDDNLHDGYCIRKNHYRWETLVRERGIEFDLIGFPSESDALQSMYDELMSIYGKKC